MPTLRAVDPDDLGVFFKHQLDENAARMAAMPVRDRPAFEAHWLRIMSDATVVLRTILVDDNVAGNLVCFGPDDQRQVGYWLGRGFWGRGIASQALAQFLAEIPSRPLRAQAAEHNTASLRILEKNGFTRVGSRREQRDGVTLVLFELADHSELAAATAGDQPVDAAGD